jgi:glycine oxidase
MFMQHPDFCIAGAGIIGLSLALELHRRGATVTVLDQGDPLAQASTAAAGMLAANDPENPPQLQPLSNLSLSLYPTYLAHLESLSGIPVPFQTSVTLQAVSTSHPAHARLLTPAAVTDLLPQLNSAALHFLHLQEHSVDPRQLAHSLLAAVQATSIDLRPQTPVRLVRSKPHSAEVHTSTEILSPISFIDCTGAWAASLSRYSHHAVVPRKGQLLSIAIPPTLLPLDIVLRTPDIYIVPRTSGPHTGHAVIGATIEDQGFDKTVHPADISRLHAAAVHLLPPLASAPIFESWAGLRPATADGLPFLGPLPRHPHHFLATGHYRNGILLAPATALVMAQVLCAENPSIDLSAFSPSRIPTQPSRRAPTAH